MFWESVQSLSLMNWILRAAVAYVWLFMVSKIMGQRELGKMTLFDFITAFVLGNVIGSYLSDSQTPLLGVVATTGVFTVLELVVAYLALKHSKFRRVMQEEPIILIKDGKILEKSLKDTRMNLDGLLTELRLSNYPNLHDVEVAVLEPTGEISVIPKSQARPLTPRDLKITTTYEGYPTVLVEDGNVLQDNLTENNLTEDWLYERLREQGFDGPNDVLAAVLDTRGRFYVSRKGESSK